MEVGTLEDLLVAEIALNRGQNQVAYDRLAKQALSSDSPTLALRAARIATTLGPETALKAALALSQFNQDYETLAILARAHLINDQVDLAVNYLRQTAEAKPDQVLGFLPRLLRADPDWAGGLAEALTPVFDSEPSLALGIPLLYATESYDGPEAALPIAVALTEQYTARPSLYAEAARLAQQSGDVDQAIELLRSGTKQHPDNENLLLTLTQLQVATEDYDAAITGFGQLSELDSNEPSYRTSQAMLAVEVMDFELAEQLGETLQAEPASELEGTLVLGLAASGQGDLDRAESLLSVIEGERFMLARTQLAQAMADQGSYQRMAQWMQAGRQVRQDLKVSLILTEADILDSADQKDRLMTLLNNALTENPDEFQLLYARALYQDPKNLKAIEADLLAALALEPENASALNALGYTYADANVKLEEALELIGRALAIRPDDSAILDSMGWVHYRLGNFSQSLSWLSRAYERFPDPEIGAHYGEVLYQDGQIEKALEVFKEAMDSDELHPVLDETLERLQIEL